MGWWLHEALLGSVVGISRSSSIVQSGPVGVGGGVTWNKKIYIRVYVVLIHSKLRAGSNAQRFLPIRANVLDVLLNGAGEHIRCAPDPLSKTRRLFIGAIVHRVSNAKFAENVADSNN